MKASELIKECGNGKGLDIFNFFTKKEKSNFNQRLCRLFAVAIARHPLVNSKIFDQRSKNSVDFGEQYADDPEFDSTLIHRAHWEASEIVPNDFTTDPSLVAATIACYTTENNARLSIALAYIQSNLIQSTRDNEIPFHYRILLDMLEPEQPIERQHRTSTVVALAQTIYQTKDYSAMPILADSLEDANYQDKEILNKLRNSNHYWFRGCYVLDAILKN